MNVSVNVEPEAEFGSQVRRRRNALGLTRKELAHRVGCSMAAIRKIESGERRPSQQIAELLAKHLDIVTDQQSAFIALARAKPPLSNVPTPLTSFIGRKQEIAELTERVKTSRLVTLTGPPGVGKTRLAIEVAHEVKDAFPDGVWWVELAPVTEPQAALATVLQALDAQPAPSLPPLDALKRHLRERNLLLVLDNLEQVLGIASLLAEVLSAVPKVMILATSREPLRIAAEQRINVQPLTTDLAAALFVQRAKTVQPGFAPTPDVNKICAKLDGLPLAIELAAARIAAFTTRELLAMLDKRLPTLTAGGRDLPERQRTLRATIDWSYTLLSTSEQVLFRQLAVFVGGCTLEAIEAVCGSEHDPSSAIMDGVAALISKNLFTRVESPNGQSRYWMLEMIREYATEKLAQSSEADQWRLRHAEYFLTLAQGLPSNYFAFIEAEVVEQLQPESDNLRAAITWCLAAPDHIEIGVRLIPAMYACAEIRGGLGAEREWLKYISSQAYNARHTLHWALALEQVGTYLGGLGDLATAYELMEESLRVSRELGDELHNAFFLGQLGRIARERDDLLTARTHLEESLALYRKLGDSLGVAGGLTTLAEVAVMQEDTNWATDLLMQGMALLDVNTNPGGIAWTLNHLGHVAQLEGDYAHAIALHEQSLSDLWRSGQLEGPANAHENLSEIALSQGDAVRAKANLVESLALFQKQGDRMGLLWCLAGFAGVAALDEEPERGARLWGASEGLRKRIGCRIAPASRLNRERTVASLREQLGDERFEAEQTIGRAMTLEQTVAYALDQG